MAEERGHMVWCGHVVARKLEVLVSQWWGKSKRVENQMAGEVTCSLLTPQ